MNNYCETSHIRILDEAVFLVTLLYTIDDVEGSALSKYVVDKSVTVELIEMKSLKFLFYVCFSGVQAKGWCLQLQLLFSARIATSAPKSTTRDNLFYNKNMALVVSNSNFLEMHQLLALSSRQPQTTSNRSYLAMLQHKYSKDSMYREKINVLKK